MHQILCLFQEDLCEFLDIEELPVLLFSHSYNPEVLVRISTSIMSEPDLEIAEKTNG